MILFAYASNMNVGEFAKTVPSAKKLCNARLPGYVFTFGLNGEDLSSKAVIVPSTEAGAEVWGVLIELKDDERENFYYPDGDLVLSPVHCFDENGMLHKAEAFLPKPTTINDFLLPYDWYQAKLVKFAKDQGLPEAYITTLSLMAHKVDPDEKRRAKRMAKLK